MLKIYPRSFLLVPFLHILLHTQLIAAVPSECQDIWRIDLHAVSHLTAGRQNFSKIQFYRLENNQWQPSDAETFFGTQRAEIPLFFFAPGYTSTTAQTTKVGIGIVQTFDPNKPCRVVFLDWYSERAVHKIRHDVRGKLPIINNTADYLALFIQDVKAQSKVCLLGFSFGGRIVCHAAEALRKSGLSPEGLRLHLVLSAAATDRDWFATGQQHSRVPEIVEKILVTYNPDDWVLRFYPFIYSCQHRAQALGLEGVPMHNITPEYRRRFENIDISRYIGDEHQTLFHVRSPAFRNRIDEYVFFE